MLFKDAMVLQATEVQWPNHSQKAQTGKYQPWGEFPYFIFVNIHVFCIIISFSLEKRFLGTPVHAECLQKNVSFPLLTLQINIERFIKCHFQIPRRGL